MTQREIIFRGQSVIGREWIYGFYAKDDEDDLIAQWNDKDGKFDYYAVIPSTIGQYTGLKDRSGREIFEGDIIDSWAGVPDDNEVYIRKVVFDDNYGVITLNPGTGYTLCRDNAMKLFEVIGTIHDTHLTQQS